MGPGGDVVGTRGVSVGEGGADDEVDAEGEGEPAPIVTDGNGGGRRALAAGCEGCSGTDAPATTSLATVLWLLARRRRRGR